MYLAIKEILQNKLRYSFNSNNHFSHCFYGLFYDQFWLSGLFEITGLLLIIGKQQELCYPIMQ